MRSLVLLDIRLPRLGLAILTGVSLALAGNAMQGIFQNPLASPGLLGSSAGATTTSVFLLYYFSVPLSLLLIGGVAGALSSFLLVYLIAKNHGTTAMIFKWFSRQYVALCCRCITTFECRKPVGIS